jgi:hypothetical protein
MAPSKVHQNKVQADTFQEGSPEATIIRHKMYKLKMPIIFDIVESVMIQARLTSLIIPRTIIRNGIMPHLWGINLSHIYAREVR